MSSLLRTPLKYLQLLEPEHCKISAVQWITGVTLLFPETGALMVSTPSIGVGVSITMAGALLSGVDVSTVPYWRTVDKCGYFEVINIAKGLYKQTQSFVVVGWEVTEPLIPVRL
jgi:hypothetical protein